MHDNYKKANLAPRCIHLRPNGLRCTQPALRARRFCRFHDPISTRNRRFDIPIVEDAPSLQVAIAEVLSALFAGKLDRHAADIAVRGLRLAAANIKDFQDQMYGAEPLEV